MNAKWMIVGLVCIAALPSCTTNQQAAREQSDIRAAAATEAQPAFIGACDNLGGSMMTKNAGAVQLTMQNNTLQMQQQASAMPVR